MPTWISVQKMKYCQTVSDELVVEIIYGPSKVERMFENFSGYLCDLMELASGLFIIYVRPFKLFYTGNTLISGRECATAAFITMHVATKILLYKIC